MKISFAQFIHEIRSEIKKITWPTQKEIIITFIMILIMTSIFSLFFVLVDSFISNLINFIFDFGSSFYDF